MRTSKSSVECRSSEGAAAEGYVHAYLAECYWILNEQQSALRSVKQALHCSGGTELWQHVVHVYAKLAEECCVEPKQALKTLHSILVVVNDRRCAKLRTSADNEQV